MYTLMSLLMGDASEISGKPALVASLLKLLLCMPPSILTVVSLMKTLGSLAADVGCFRSPGDTLVGYLIMPELAGEFIIVSRISGLMLARAKGMLESLCPLGRSLSPLSPRP